MHRHALVFCMLYLQQKREMYAWWDEPVTVSGLRFGLDWELGFGSVQLIVFRSGVHTEEGNSSEKAQLVCSCSCYISFSWGVEIYRRAVNCSCIDLYRATGVCTCVFYS